MLETILGIDNLIFIAILDKLPSFRAIEGASSV